MCACGTCSLGEQPISHAEIVDDLLSLQPDEANCRVRDRHTLAAQHLSSMLHVCLWDLALLQGVHSCAWLLITLTSRVLLLLNPCRHRCTWTCGECAAQQSCSGLVSTLLACGAVASMGQ